MRLVPSPLTSYAASVAPCEMSRGTPRRSVTGTVTATRPAGTSAMVEASRNVTSVRGTPLGAALPTSLPRTSSKLVSAPSGARSTNHSRVVTLDCVAMSPGSSAAEETTKVTTSPP